MTGTVMPTHTLSTGGETPTTFLILREFPNSELERSWRECLTRVELPAHYNAPEYFLSPFWQGKRPFAILALQGSRVVGILTGIHDGKDLNCGLQSRPQICIDKTLEQAAVEQALAKGLLEEADGESLLNVYSWMLLESFQGLGFRHRQLEGNVVLDLTIGAERLFNGLHRNRRRDVRLAIRNGMEVSEASNQEDLLEYYDVYVKWHQTERKKIVSELRPLESFLQERAVTDNSRLFVARYKGTIVAGITVRFFPGGLVQYASNCSLDEFMRLLPNDLLVWKMVEWACSNGFQKLSMGGAHRFLKKWGGTVVPIHRYRIDRTWLRRFDLREAILDFGRDSLHRMPTPIEKTVRRILGKN